MDTLRIKMKVGEHEFEADGPADIVQRQLESFKDLIANLPNTSAAQALAPLPESLLISAREVLPTLPLEKILKSEGRVVSLTAKAQNIEEAILLILLGQKENRNNESVTGSELMDGLKQSGYSVDRIDRTMDKLDEEGSLITVGVHRARRYRLSNSGLSKALLIAKEVIATVP